MPISPDDILEAVQSTYLPVMPQPVELTPRTGLVIVDIVKGFAAVGHGPLAPPEPNPQVTQMVEEADRLAKRFLEQKLPVLAFLDTHVSGKAEPPYPPHCEIGSGQENFVDALAWLDREAAVTAIRKDCINGFIGAMNAHGQNEFIDWVQTHGLRRLITVGICTDICVMDFILTTLSARNHGLLGELADIIVYADGCATYGIDPAGVDALSLPKSATHPQALAHHIGLYCMASRGAIIASHIL